MDLDGTICFPNCQAEQNRQVKRKLASALGDEIHPARKPQDKVYARWRGGGVKADRHLVPLPRSMQEFEPDQN